MLLLRLQMYFTFPIFVFASAVLLRNNVFVHSLTEPKQGILWSGSGGGWRAMISSIGFINAYKNAGLLDLDKKQFNITAMSTTSGASWALVQLAYSQPFFDKAVPKNTKNVQPFILNWMNSFREFITDNSDSTDPDILNNVTLYKCVN
jgi:hypothetical protein